MAIKTRKLHFKDLIGDATQHVGRRGDVFFDPNSTNLRISDGVTPGGNEIGGSSYNSNQLIDYGVGIGANKAINLTKKYHWLTDLGNGYYYTLAAGTEGQELVFLPCVGLGYGAVAQSDILVNSAKVWNDAGGSSGWIADSRVIRCFSKDNAHDSRAMVTALFINGAWHFNGGEDLGGY